MNLDRPGDRLIDLVSTARETLTIVAPFIKANALAHALTGAGECTLTVITRWRPEEIQAGVSDLEVIDVVKSRPGAMLRLCDRLHAKYYRADDQVLLGSANLTALGMGWRSGANIELLRPHPYNESMKAFEKLVMAESYQRSIKKIAAQARQIKIAMVNLRKRNSCPSSYRFTPT